MLTDSEWQLDRVYGGCCPQLAGPQRLEHTGVTGAGAGLQKEGVFTHSSGAGLTQKLGMCPRIPQVTSMCPEFSKAW